MRVVVDGTVILDSHHPPDSFQPLTAGKFTTSNPPASCM